MAYSDLGTFNTGDILTAATMTQVRLNDEALIDPPTTSAYNSAAQSIPNATATKLTANAELFDNDSIHSMTVDTSRLTIQTSGRYLVFGAVRFAASGAGVTRSMEFLVNNVTLLLGVSGPQLSAFYDVGLATVRSKVFVAGDYVETRVFHDAGAALNCTLSEFGILKVTR